MIYKKIAVVVVDSFGIGQDPKAETFGDSGADTMGHILEKKPNVKIPNLYSLGLGELHPSSNQPITKGYACILQEKSNAKDTMAGHWEMMGVITREPFKTFTETGFPKELVSLLEAKTGHTYIGNKSASGTEILAELAAEEKKSNGQKLILYTSADSVLQICGNENIIGLEELYHCCEVAREITMKEEWKVGRVIARPYIEDADGHYVRTSNRHDYALSPPSTTVLDECSQAGLATIGIGKISDIFNGHGIQTSLHSTSSVHGMHQTIEEIQKDFTGVLFTNLVDFDAKWGHRRNVEGYAKELEDFDVLLSELLKCMDDDTLLIITADHGNDPTFKGTDHTRECVPCMMYSKKMKQTGVLPLKHSFDFIGSLICDNFDIQSTISFQEKSMLSKLK